MAESDDGLGRQPAAERIPPPPEGNGSVVWHREHLRVSDQLAVTTAARADAVLPLFVFDPAFYGDSGLACDARIRFLHDCLHDLDAAYETVGDVGLTYAHGDPIEILTRFRDAGWDVVAMASATGRYGRDRDDRAEADCDVTFVGGDGLVRGTDETRENWQASFESWVTAPRHSWDPESVAISHVPTDVTVDAVDAAYDIDPSKSQVPTGGRAEARRRLERFVDRIAEYPGNISSPNDARDGCSGLSPYLRFGCLSVREVYQYVDERAPDGRGREMFLSRLAWNKHYEQKLADWPGWLDTAVNPVLRGFNADRHDPTLVAAWKDGRTGYPMVDASMRCLRDTGWLNFRMRAMCASFFYHVLQQPWQIGADYYHYHLVDSVAGINYTQWQSQAGLIGKPTLRLYNPRKQVRDQDPDGEWIRRWVPELETLPDDHLDAPEKTPLHVQQECGVRIGEGEEYPRPVVDYESARERFLRRYERVKPTAAARLGDPAVARRASLSGGRAAAASIAERHGNDTAATGSSETATDTQRTLDSFVEE